MNNMNQEMKRNAYDLAFLIKIADDNTRPSLPISFAMNPMLAFRRAPEPYSRYIVNQLGEVKGLSGEILKPHYNNAGYPVLQVTKNDGKSTTITVSRLAALTWLPNPDGLSDVDHVDTNKTNNAVSNLRWLSHADNLRKRAKKGGKHSVTPVELATGRKTEYASISAAAVALGISYSTIRGIANGTYSLPSAGGYYFTFIK